MHDPPSLTLPLDELPDPLPIAPLRRPFDVTITPPGSKSITNRAYVLAALAQGESRLVRPLRADDTDRLLDALCTLGVRARWEGEDVLITGVDGRFPKGGEVNLGDGGTPTRFMIAAACLAAEPVVVDGSKRMRERPIAEGVDMLRQLGATIEYVPDEGRLPVRVVPSETFRGGEIEVGETQSSQFISALILIASGLERGLRITMTREPTSATYVWLTVDLLQKFGGVAERSIVPNAVRRARTIEVAPHALAGTEYAVDADASSAVYWALAVKVAGTVEFSTGTLRGLPIFTRQPDMQAIQALDSFGGSGRYDTTGMDHVVLGEGELKGSTVDCAEFPDGAMALAIAGAIARGETRLTGLRTLRVKETDRIAALANELTRVGCTVETTDDSITIRPIPRDAKGNLLATDPVEIETYHDHRMAMAFAVLGLVRPNLSIRNPACVSKSYPTFWRDFATLYGDGGST